MQLADIMTPNPRTVAPHESVGQALGILHDLDIRHLPVVEDGALVGMLSDRDLRGLAMASTGGDETELAAGRYLDRPVIDVTHGDVISIDTEEEVGEAISIMIEHRVGALPVVEDGDRLVGIVSYIDILRELRDLL